MTLEDGVLWTEGSECRKALRHGHPQVLVKRKVSMAQVQYVKGRRGHGEKQGWGRCTLAGELDSVSFTVEGIRRHTV